MWPYINSKIPILDSLFGLRAWGLIGYGLLPSHLSLLGFRGPIEHTTNLKSYYLFLASIIPIFLLFLLIRSRLKQWYINKKYLWIRTGFITITIVIGSIVICRFSSIISTPLEQINESGDFWNTAGLTESLRIALASLTLSSTLMMSALTKKTILPGLPSPLFVEKIYDIKSNLGEIYKKIWGGVSEPESNIFLLSEYLSTVEQEISSLILLSENKIASIELREITKELTALSSQIDDIANSLGPDKTSSLKELYYPENILNEEEELTTDTTIKLLNIEKLKSRLRGTFG